ncbi:hypothetical protein CRG98_011993 [Punica granatum]|uniref:Uncharacterized protein n=1 Tax=Punica granatum TaxID=22663 RepID=A0A2I0KHD8_PUNGR|nr:hypothetical protein CRG98_011993 [Punica granatum]
MQELRPTLIPDHSGYVGAPPQSSSPLACSIPQSKIPHFTAGASPAKVQWPNSKAAFQRKCNRSSSNVGLPQIRIPRVSHPSTGFHTHTTAVKVSHPHTGFHTHTTAVRVSHPHRRVSHPHTGFHTHTAAVRVSHPLRCIRVSHPHTGFHTHTAAVRVSHPLRCIRVSHPHTGFHTHTTTVRVSHPFRCIRVSHPHRRSQGFTPAPLHSGFTPVPLLRSGFHTLSAAFGFHTLTPVFTPTPPQSGFHSRSAAFGFHTHTAAVRVSHPLRCIRVSHPHRRSQGFTPAPLHSGFTPTYRVSHSHYRSQGFTPVLLHSGLTPTLPQSGFYTRSAAFGFHTHTSGFTSTPPQSGTVLVDPTTLGTNDHHGHLEGSLAIQGRRPCLKIPSGASVVTSDPTCANRVYPPFHSGLFGAIRVCSTENSPNPTHQRSNPTLEDTIPHLGTRYDHSRLRGARTFTLLLCLWSFKGFEA